MPSSTPHPLPQPEFGLPEHVDLLVDAIVAGADDYDIELLHDLSRSGAARLRERWFEMAPETRMQLTGRLAADAEQDVLHHFDRAMLIALDDTVASVRLISIEGMAELESDELLRSLTANVEAEPDEAVRAASASALGRFALRAELGDIDESEAERLKDLLLRLVEDDPSSEVQRRALESVAWFAGDEEIADYIQESWDSGVHGKRVSALFAMGRQADARWLDVCLEQLDDDEPDIRYEAVTAAGIIGDERAVPRIIDVTHDEDAEVAIAAVGALGAIGGRMAVNALRSLIDDPSPAIAEAASEALEEAQLSSNPLRLIF